MGIIKASKLIFDYVTKDEEEHVEDVNRAIDDIDLDIKAGEFVAILGHNGSGKSTFAKTMNGILLPTEGTVWISGMKTTDDESLWDVRRTVGMVFQNPDNQIIGNVVEEDVGFGPENLGVPTEEIWKRVDESLRAVEMTAYRLKSPNRLSGGQKQRVAIAGVMAMKPKCIVLDEPTAMLDPNGRREVIKTITELNRKEHITVVLITHYMEEVINADRVIVMDDGKVVMDGTPRQVFSRVSDLKSYRLDVPQVTELAYELKCAGLNMPDGILSIDELMNNLLPALKNAGPFPGREHAAETAGEEKTENAGTPEKQDIVLKAEHLSYIYGQGTAFEQYALKDVNFEIPAGQFVGLIGHTGSGKSTLIQHLDGLIRATEGKIYYRGADIYAQDFDMRALRAKVGLVFQYPEHQLFEVDVLSDVCFGPKNLGLSKEEAEAKAKEALSMVGLDESFYRQSPFELSGGQKRRVAIAGVLAMEPEVLILDEPTAGLDPRGRDEILDRVNALHEEKHITVILVSHSMEDIAKYADRIMVMNSGEKVFDDTPKKIFRHYRELEKIGLSAPQITYIIQRLKENGIPADEDITTVPEAKNELLKLLGKES
jgi:energy-coupling factor transporter ATPase